TGIEGPACDAQGNIYAVNFERQLTIGKVTPDGKGEVFVELPGNSIGNGIVIGRDGTMYVADYVGHNILRIAPKSRAVSAWAHDDRMNQPNDLAIAPSGSLYASDPSWKDGTGQVWLATPAGKLSLVATNLGTSNGIEVSPDAKTLYVTEVDHRRLVQFRVDRPGLAFARLRTAEPSR